MACGHCLICLNPQTHTLSHIFKLSVPKMSCNHDPLFLAIIFAHLLLPLMNDLLISAENIQNCAINNDTVIISALHVINSCNKHCLLDLFRCIFFIRSLLSFSCMFSKVTIVHCLNQHIVCTLFIRLTIIVQIREKRKKKRSTLTAHCSLFANINF